MASSDRILNCPRCNGLYDYAAAGMGVCESCDKSYAILPDEITVWYDEEDVDFDDPIDFEIRFNATSGKWMLNIWVKEISPESIHTSSFQCLGTDVYNEWKFSNPQYMKNKLLSYVDLALFW